MGILCYDALKEPQFISEIHLTEKEEQKESNDNKDINDINNNNIIVFNLQSRFTNKIIKDEEVLKIKNKNTIKNIKRRISLINRYKFHEDKLEKFIKFTHMNKIVSSTTNSIMKQ